MLEILSNILAVIFVIVLIGAIIWSSRGSGRTSEEAYFNAVQKRLLVGAVAFVFFVLISKI